MDGNQDRWIHYRVEDAGQGNPRWRNAEGRTERLGGTRVAFLRTVRNRSCDPEFVKKPSPFPAIFRPSFCFYSWAWARYSTLLNVTTVCPNCGRKRVARVALTAHQTSVTLHSPPHPPFTSMSYFRSCVLLVVRYVMLGQVGNGRERCVDGEYEQRSSTGQATTWRQ